MTSRLVVGLMLATAVAESTLVGRTVFAQEAAAVQQAIYRDAHRAIARKDWAGARELLLPLWASSPTYDVASTLAQVEYQLGDYPSAATYMAFALEHVAPVEEAQTVERMRRGMLELRGRVGGLKLSTNVPQAEVVVDGRVVPRSALGREVFVLPGPHLIEARAQGLRPARQPLEIIAGQTYTVELELGNVPLVSAPPARNLGRVSALSASSPTSDQKPASKPLWPVLVGSSLAAVGVSMTIGFGVSANSARSDWKSLQSSVPASACFERPASVACAELRSAIDRQHQAATWANVGVGLATVSALVTGAYLLFWPETPRSEREALEPSLSVATDSAALGLAGRF
jgi:hypothetical protein